MTAAQTRAGGGLRSQQRYSGTLGDGSQGRLPVCTEEEEQGVGGTSRRRLPSLKQLI
jgi:hypothetical protein